LRLGTDHIGGDLLPTDEKGKTLINAFKNFSRVFVGVEIGFATTYRLDKTREVEGPGVHLRFSRH